VHAFARGRDVAIPEELWLELDRSPWLRLHLAHRDFAPRGSFSAPSSGR
jgi:hypothetical protein